MLTRLLFESGVRHQIAALLLKLATNLSKKLTAAAAKEIFASIVTTYQATVRFHVKN